MPPKTNAVDGISKVAVALPPQPQAPSQNVSQNSIPAPAVKAPKKVAKTKVKASATVNKPTVAILITLIIMVLLIGLAYFAYRKSN